MVEKKDIDERIVLPRENMSWKQKYLANKVDLNVSVNWIESVIQGVNLEINKSKHAALRVLFYSN